MSDCKQCTVNHTCIVLPLSTQVQIPSPFNMQAVEGEQSVDISYISLGDQPDTPSFRYMEDYSAEPQLSPVAPPFSPISPVGIPFSPLSPVATPPSPLSPTALTLSHTLQGSSQSSISKVQDETSQSPLPQWYGFKLVGDNSDKNVRPQHQTLEH